ncbi:MAG: type II secretion system F family protein [Candidatus Rokuibacteriota bacterium]
MSHGIPFDFKAMRRDGTLEKGVVAAASREAAVALLGRRGAFAIHVSHGLGPLLAARISPDDLALGLRALATLLAAGIPLGRALAVLDDLLPPAWRAALSDLRRRVEQGEHLAAALEESPLPLPSHVIGIIRAGEAGSGLAAAVESSAQLLEARAATRAALRNALAYPSILIVAGSAAVALLVGVVLPRFAAILADTGRALPLSTRLVLGLGAISRVALLPGLVALVFTAVLWRKWVTNPDGRARWHKLLLGAPVVGPIRRSAAATNGCSALAALLDAGVPLPAALPHAARATGDRAVEASLLAARQRIGRGERISSALLAENAFTPTVIRLVGIGEETGRLASMLAHAARVESAHALQRLQRAIRVLEPVLILLFGGVVMLVAAALLQAMYGLRPSG